MKLIEINWKPDDRQLRQFGLICLPGIPLAGWLVTRGHGANSTVLGLLAGIGLAFALAAMIRPGLLKYVFLAATIVTLPIGMVVSELILVLIYFGLFTPIALLFRLMGRDALDRAWNKGANSYWVSHTQATDATRYFQQY